MTGHGGPGPGCLYHLPQALRTELSAAALRVGGESPGHIRLCPGPSEALKRVLHEERALSPVKLLGGSYAEAAKGWNPVCSN